MDWMLDSINFFLGHLDKRGYVKWLTVSDCN